MTTAIILGAAVWANGPSPTLLRRTRHGAALYHGGQVEHIIVSGGLGVHPPSEAKAMQAILVAEGVPPDAITLEDRSTNTAENLRLSLPLLPDGPVIIVSDWYHLPRAKLVARRLGVAGQGSAPAHQGAHRGQQIRSALREVPAYLLYRLGFR